ncbi:MAG: hypothetical protein KME21_13795 [Desmonostoc vinosum HA7617-LM4]|nr:hypothetical protein [Desmonostoc vinosum HA7617-LM4]
MPTRWLSTNLCRRNPQKPDQNWGIGNWELIIFSPALHPLVGEFRLRGNRAKSRFNYRRVEPHHHADTKPEVLSCVAASQIK